VLLWRAVLAWGSKPLPARWWLMGLLAITVAATWFSHRTLVGKDAGVTLLVVLLTLKTLELRAKRDAFVVFFLGFFVLLTNFLHSQSLPTAVAMVLGFVGLLTALVNAHMPVGKPPLAASAKITLKMIVYGAPIVAVLFVLFPRMAPLWGMPGDTPKGRSGLSNRMQVGTIASLALDDSIALRLKFDGPVPQAANLYFRGPVFSLFDGREWRPASVYGTRPSSTPPPVQTQGEPLRYQVTLEPNQRPWLMVLDATIDRPTLPDSTPAANQEPPGITAELQWLMPQPITELTRYRAQSYPQFSYGPQDNAARPSFAAELPVGFNPKTLQLAAQVLNQVNANPALTADPVNLNTALSNAVLQRLRTGGYSYTLDPGVYGEHTADEFWFDRKEGFCEHIASAYVVLMRAMSVPARVVTGYQGGELNNLDGYWVVRQSDAHAWAEYWQAGRGWVRVDPTGAVAPGRIGELLRLSAQPGLVGTALGTLSPNLAAQLRAAWDAVNNSWNQWVLTYSKTSQFNLLKDLGFATPEWRDLGYLLSGLLALASALGAAWTLWERRQHDPWLRLLHAAQQRIAPDAAAHTAPRQLAQMAEHQWGNASAPIQQWLLRLEQWRYAGQATAHELKALQQAWRKINRGQIPINLQNQSCTLKHHATSPNPASNKP
jgi:transglutaminase-like putative cysteine protease